MKVCLLLTWLQSSWKLFEVCILNGSEQEILHFRWAWSFCWNLSNVISGGNWFFRSDCVFSGGLFTPLRTMRKTDKCCNILKSHRCNSKAHRVINLEMAKILKEKSIQSILHPEVFWYRLNGMGAQKSAPKKVLVTLFPYIFHVKTKWNIVYEYLKTKFFSRDTNILPQMHWTSNIFGPSATTIGGFWVSLNYLILNFKKMVCPKNVWIQHCQWWITWSKIM